MDTAPRLIAKGYPQDNLISFCLYDIIKLTLPRQVGQEGRIF